MRPRYAGVGSRDTPEDILCIQFRLGKTFCDIGFQGISGEAPGSDQIYHEGAKQSKRYGEVGFEVFLPWNGFEKVWHDPKNNVWDFAKTGFSRRAWWLGIGARGTDSGLKRGGMAMHSRNAMQILGGDLVNPVRFVSCWAKPRGKEGHVQGGTGTAVALAMHFGIEVLNLYTDDAMERALNFLDKHEIRDERTVETNVAEAVYAAEQSKAKT